jgi:signal peptidase II
MYRGLVAAATIATILLVMYFFLTSPAKAWAVHLALAMILGGALGNLYDRLWGSVTVPGYEPIRYQVRDFIDCSSLHYPWVFNVADAWLVLGVAILLFAWWRMGRTADHSPSGAAKN